MIKIKDGRTELYQWDTGSVLTVGDGIDEVHFARSPVGRSITVPVANGEAKVEDVLLQTAGKLFVWGFVGTAEAGYTKLEHEFTVRARNKPADYVFTPPEQITLSEILEELKRVQGVVTPEAVGALVEEYLRENPVGGAVQIDDTLTKEGYAADAAAVGDAVEEIKTAIGSKPLATLNIINTETMSDGIIMPNGTISAASVGKHTDFIDVKPNDVLRFVNWSDETENNPDNVTQQYPGETYDADGNFVARIMLWQAQTETVVVDDVSTICGIYTIPQGVYKVRLNVQRLALNKAMATVNAPIPSRYTPYQEHVALRDEIAKIENEIADFKTKIDKSLTLTDGNTVNITSDNLFNPADLEVGGYYAWNTGAWVDRSDISSTGFIACESGQTFYASRDGTVWGGNATFYNANFEYLSGADISVGNSIVIPENEDIRYFRLSLYRGNAERYQINKDSVKEYDEYTAIIIDFSVYFTEHDVIAPNITELEEKVKFHDEQLAAEEKSKSAKVLYYNQSYKDSVSIMHKRNNEIGTTYWLFVINSKNFDGSKVKPVIAGTNASNPLGGDGITNVANYATTHDSLHVINGGIFLVESGEADGITIINSAILKSTGVEQFNTEQYVLGINDSGDFKVYRNETAENILADGYIYALTGFVPLIEDGATVAENVLSICPHYHTRNPRQIIGRLANGDYFTFACDGRTDNENGMTLRECIDTIMNDLDVKFAFNLDGGGSTQSAVGKKLVNRIIDNRTVPNVIVFQ